MKKFARRHLALTTLIVFALIGSQVAVRAQLMDQLKGAVGGGQTGGGGGTGGGMLGGLGGGAIPSVGQAAPGNTAGVLQVPHPEQICRR